MPTTITEIYVMPLGPVVFYIIEIPGQNKALAVVLFVSHACTTIRIS